MPFKDPDRQRAAQRDSARRRRAQKRARSDAAKRGAATRRRRAAERAGSPVEAFERFCKRIGLALEPFQREIATELLSGRRELLILLPRGNGKTTLMAALGLHHLLTTPRAEIICCAASRDQAAILFDAARSFALELAGVEVTRRELRSADGVFRVVSSDAFKQHGWSPTLVLVDELHAHRTDDLFLAMQTALAKRSGAQMVTISTAGVRGSEGPLELLRARALALPSVERAETLTRARGDHFAMLEWSLPDDWPLDRVKECNPASWVTAEVLAEMREAIQESAYRRYICNQWQLAESFWLPPGAWQKCAADYTIEPGTEVWLGVDIGGSRAASAVVWATEDLRVGVRVFQGDESVLAVQQRVRELASEFTVRELCFDPWRFKESALQLQQEGLPAVEFPQSNARMVPASERLYAAVVEQRLKHPNDPDLNRHVAAAVAKQTERGWRLAKLDTRAQIDAVVALAMAIEAVERRPPPVELLGWI